MAEQWTIIKMIDWLKGYLEAKCVPEPRLNAEHLIAHALKIKRLDLYLQFERVLTTNELATLRPLIERRAKREPLQYILGSQPFRNVDIKVSPAVLIPRPETETVVGEALKLIRENSTASVLEVGVGSGAISAALADERKNITVTGTEISPAAIDVAKENTRRFDGRVTLLLGDLFEPVRGRKFDVIISNPPYCAEKEWTLLQPEVKDYEPKGALLAGEEGLDFHRRIIDTAPDFLNEGGWLVLEFGDGQADAVLSFAGAAGKYKEIRIVNDLNREKRGLVASV